MEESIKPFGSWRMLLVVALALESSLLHAHRLKSPSRRIKSTVLWLLITEHHPTNLALASLPDYLVLSLRHLSSPPIHHAILSLVLDLLEVFLGQVVFFLLLYTLLLYFPYFYFHLL